MIQPDQILTYDNAAKKVRDALTLLNTIKIADMNPDDARACAQLVREAHVLVEKLIKQAIDARVEAADRGTYL